MAKLTQCDYFQQRYEKGRADAIELLEKTHPIDKLLEKMHPCANCPSYPNECNHTEYFEDCCRTEKTLSWEDLRNIAEQLKEQTNG